MDVEVLPGIGGGTPHAYVPSIITTAVVDHYAPTRGRDAGGATGPEVILFQEFEVDQTPGGSPFDYAAFLRRTKGR